jgi:dCMP deaminase
VGAIIVKDDRIISLGINGTPSGWDNTCEDVIEHYEDGGMLTKTKPEVMHAEENAICKLAKSTESGEGSVMFCTHAPCIACAKLIYGAGITKVFYRNIYRCTDGIDFLEKCGVTTHRIPK